MNWYDKAKEAADFLNKRLDARPKTAIQLGTGAESVLSSFSILGRIPYREVPFFDASTFHKGEFILAQTNNKMPVLIMNGRFHYYEGFSAKQVTFPIRVLSVLAIKNLIMTNASGGLNPDYKAGQIVLVKDHINLLPEHPLRGVNDDRFGLRFPDMLEAYSLKLRNQIKSTWKEIHNEDLKEGVYVGFQGPSLETPAEYTMLHRIGGDMVGMSTVPEVIVANHCGINTAVLSIVTNVCYPPENITQTTIEEVINMANKSTEKLGPILPVVVAALEN